MSDIFGVNGRRILDGLVAGRPPGRILADLTTHVQAKLEPLAQALAAALDPLALLKLQMQIETLDRADAAIAVLDTRIRTELAEYQRPLRLFPGTWSSGALRRRRYRRSTGSSRTTWLGPPRCSTAR